MPTSALAVLVLLTLALAGCATSPKPDAPRTFQEKPVGENGGGGGGGY